MQTLRNASITSVPGFRASGIYCGIKPDPQRLDLAVIVSENPASAAAVFTTNRFKSAHILYDQEVLRTSASAIRAVVINSGCANACTGARGVENARETARAAAEAAGLPPDSVLVMSTGVIGVQLPMEKILAGIPQAVGALSADGGHAAERAIMTTDTRPKEAAVRVALPDGREVTIAGMAKGAGMIHPNMATLLAVIATDARIAPELLQKMITKAADASFNRISVDGDTSTNDTLLLLAAGGPDAPAIVADDAAAVQAFMRGLKKVAARLAKKVVMDGEGASKFIAIRVKGARTAEEARRAANAIATSCLVKTAFFGEDPNWGRILSAVGNSGIEVDPARTDLYFLNSVGKRLQLVSAGTPLNYDEGQAHEMLTGRKVGVLVNLRLGHGRSVVWASDLSYDYVKINAHYRT